jgi:hypothetical protein
MVHSDAQFDSVCRPSDKPGEAGNSAGRCSVTSLWIVDVVICCRFPETAATLDVSDLDWNNLDAIGADWTA